MEHWRILGVIYISFKVRETRPVGPVGLIKITLSGFSDNERSENKSKPQLKSLIYNYASWNQDLISQKDNEWLGAPFFIFLIFVFDDFPELTLAKALGCSCRWCPNPRSVIMGYPLSPTMDPPTLCFLELSNPS